jgi:amino acid transporter
VEVFRVALMMVLSIALTVAVQVVLKRRLPEERRERGWNGASWGAAVYAFGPGSMLGFFWVTRRPGKGGAALALLGGVLSAAAILGAMVGIDALLDLVLGPSSGR